MLLSFDHRYGDLPNLASLRGSGVIGEDIRGVCTRSQPCWVNVHQEVASAIHEVEVGGVGDPGGGAGHYKLPVEALFVCRWPVVVVEEDRLHLDWDLLSSVRFQPAHVDALVTAPATAHSILDVSGHGIFVGNQIIKRSLYVEESVTLTKLTGVLQGDRRVGQGPLHSVRAPSKALSSHAREQQSNGTSNMRRGHRGSVHQLGASHTELGHRGNGSSRGTNCNTSVAINGWTTGSPGKRSAREFFSGAVHCSHHFGANVGTNADHGTRVDILRHQFPHPPTTAPVTVLSIAHVYHVHLVML